MRCLEVIMLLREPAPRGGAVHCDHLLRGDLGENIVDVGEDVAGILGEHGNRPGNLALDLLKCAPGKRVL